MQRKNYPSSFPSVLEPPHSDMSPMYIKFHPERMYFQWKGEMLINADGEFLSINEGMIMDDFPTPPHANSIRFIYILELFKFF